ncbi:MAG: Rpn family recombination-promoting nuclease/putative transposase [Treponema sp.]|nr:Rpn family recombination-promoting nuclease/putative transposase [Treponema sp.]MCL2237532.1 Rpn family recombination-promoting nuclease/putative transposase [Treponema sp.]
MNPNRTYKDSVFTSLFSDSEILRELYSAIGGISLPDDVPISINTLENILVKDIYNDISFLVGSKLVVLIEHQSTINPNMALRLLMYMAETYKQMIKEKNIYSGKKVSIPYPEFYVLYDGVDSYPDKATLKLSDLFEYQKELGLVEKSHPLLELEVKVLNINEGRNCEIANRCRKLSEYSIFISKVREFMDKYNDLLKAIREAVKYCQEHDILREYLEKHGYEVINMLYYEYNQELEREVIQEEAFEDGHAQGLKQGHAEGLEQVYKEKQAIARNLLAEGSTPEFVQKITGLSLDEIAGL